MKQREPKSGRRKRDVPLAEAIRTNRALDNVSAATKGFMRKLTTITTLSTSVGGYIPATQMTSDSARLANDWSSFASRFTQFRVRAIKCTLIPCVDITTAVNVGGGAVTPHPGPLMFGKYMEGTGYVNAAALASGANRKIFNGREMLIEYEVTWDGVPEAKLWASTGAAIPTAQLYGIQFQDFANGPTSAASTVYYRWLQEYLVEFLLPA